MPDGPLSPEEVAHRGFGTGFRGFDTSEVRSYLQRVANELRAGTARERELNRRLAEAEHRAANPVLDRDTLTKALGEEMARILATAQSAATELKAKAEENAARILREAHDQAQQIRAKAEVILAERTEEADQEAAEIRRAAEAEAAGLVERARLEAAGAIADVDARTRQVVQEAQTARARVIGDLTRRRKALQAQVEQLRAGRERLLEAYRVVRRTTDEVADELQKVETEAREAAIRAGERAAATASADHAEEMEDVLAAFSGEPEAAGDDEGSGPATGEGGAAGAEAGEAVSPEDAAAAGAAAPVAGEEPGPPAPGAGPPAEPHPDAPAEAGEGRRSPTLRLLRRPREGRPARPDVAGGSPTADEGVRIIGTRPGAPALGPAPVTPDVEQAPGTAATAETPEEGPPLAEPAPAGGEAPAAEPAEPSPPAPAPVDELFARIRAGREDAVARAHEVLASHGDEGVETAPAAGSDAPGASPQAEAAATGAGDSAGEEALLQRRDRAVEGIEVRLARKLKRALQDEQNEVLDRLRSSRTASPGSVLPAPGHHADRYRRTAEELLEAAAAAGASFVAPGGDVAPVVTDLAAELGSSLSEPLRRALERALDAEAGTDPTVLVERIGAAYRECKGQRIEGLAGDAATAAFSRGALAAMAPGAPARWVVDDDGRPCPDCDDNALAGPTPAGETFPTGQPHPPAHAGCRCLLAPAEVAAAANGAPPPASP